MELPHLVRIAMCALALCSIPQGLASYVHGTEAFAALLISLRVVEGFFVATIELCAFTSILRLFRKPSEYLLAQGITGTVRSALTVASAPVGSILYTSLGMAGPYAVVGYVVLLLSLVTRFAIGSKEASALRGGHSSGDRVSEWQLLQIPAFASCMLSLTTAFFLLSGFEATWQPWLGAQGPHQYGWSPNQISTATLTMAGVMTASSMLFGTLGAMFVGNLVSISLGEVLMLGGLLLVGTPPAAFPGLVPRDWVPYVASSLIGTGLGMVIVPSTPLMLRIVKCESGEAADKCERAMSTFAIGAPFVGLFLGPVIGGYVISHASVSVVALVFGGVVVVVLLLQVVLCRQYVHVREVGE